MVTPLFSKISIGITFLCYAGKVLNKIGFGFGIGVGASDFFQTFRENDVF